MVGGQAKRATFPVNKTIKGSGGTKFEIGELTIAILSSKSRGEGGLA